MAVEIQDIEPFLGVGCPVVFQLYPFERGGTRCTTVIRGWRKPSYLLLDRPKSGERYAAIRENQPCIVRFVREGKACAFDSLVLDWDARPHNAYCRVEWPKVAQAVSFRRFERIKVQAPCRISVGDRVEEGRVEDLSIGGCRITAVSSINPGSEIDLEFSLPDGCEIDGVFAVVRNAQTVGDRASMGCEFMAGQACTESNIAFFITTALDRAGIRSGDDRQILIIDDTPARIIALRTILQDRGYEVLVATETLDGLSRLRIAPPVALLINYAQDDLDGLRVARLVLMTRGLESLPTFLYGVADPELHRQAKAIGVAGCFGLGADARPMADAIVSSLVAKQK